MIDFALLLVEYFAGVCIHVGFFIMLRRISERSGEQ